jgi:hypothetical protein
MAEKKKKNKKSAAKPAAVPKTPAKKKFRAPMQIIMAFVCLLMFVMQLSVIFQPEGGIPLAVRGLLLGLITCGIYSIYWQYKFYAQQIAIAKASGVETSPTDSPILMLLLGFVPIYSFYVICDNYNRTANAN